MTDTTRAEDIRDMLVQLRRLLVILKTLPDRQWVSRFERLENWTRDLPAEDNSSSSQSPPDTDMAGFGTLLESTPLLHDPLSQFLGALKRYSD